MTIYISPIGVDGSGKSSCFKQILEMLCKNHSVIGIGDEVWQSQNQKLLKVNKGWIAKIKVSSGRLAKKIRNRFWYKIVKTTELILRVNLQNILCRRYNPDFVVTDGSTLINLVGWGSYYHPDSFSPEQVKLALQFLSGKISIPLTKIWFYLRKIPEIIILRYVLRITLPVPDLTVFLTVSPQVAIERIIKRGTEKQVHETTLFLKKLQQAYETVCTALKQELGKRVAIIETDKLDLDATRSKLENILHEYS